MTDKKMKKWEAYHESREELISALEKHFDNICNVNVYNNVSNTSGDYELMNESMGKGEVYNLIVKLKR
jgi:hypothetical protein